MKNAPALMHCGIDRLQSMNYGHHSHRIIHKAKTTSWFKFVCVSLMKPFKSKYDENV